MAWWSLYKWFGSFRTTPFENMITWYTNKLNHEWYQSLYDEEKEQYIKKAEKGYRFALFFKKIPTNGKKNIRRSAENLHI